MEMPTTKTYVDWTSGGDFGQVGEDVTADVRVNPGIRYERGRDSARLLSPPMAGKCSFALNNQDGLYSPQNVSSPLYGNLEGGRAVKVERILSGVTYPIWRGLTEDIEVTPGRAPTVRVPALGLLSSLKGTRISTALYERVRTDQCLAVILDAVGWPMQLAQADCAWGTGVWGTARWVNSGWPSQLRVLNQGATTLDYWWLDDQDAFDAVVDLLATEGPGACVYEDKLGRCVFEGRHYRLMTARCTTSRATLRYGGAEPCFSAISYNPGLRDVINHCTIEIATRRVAPTASKVWETEDTLAFGPNEERSFTASAAEPFKDAITPFAGTDFVIVNGSVSTVSLDRTSGARCTITIKAGASGATLQGLRLRAKPVEVQTTETLESTIDTSASRLKYNKRTHELRARQEVPRHVAQGLCDAVVALYQWPRPTVEITVNAATEERLEQLLTREISDRIHIVEASSFIDDDYFIERISGSITGKEFHTVQYGCEKVNQANYALWGAGVWGTHVWGF